jgi:hypothetical protein
VDRSLNIADGALFILPVCIDDTPEAEARVPEKFRALHITRLPGGEPSPEFVRRLRELGSAGRACAFRRSIRSMGPPSGR